MPSLAAEQDHLDKAEGDSAEREERMARQAEFVGRLRRAGREAAAEVLLANMRQTLAEWKYRHDVIVCTIAHLQRKAEP